MKKCFLICKVQHIHKKFNRMQELSQLQDFQFPEIKQKKYDDLEIIKDLLCNSSLFDINIMHIIESFIYWVKIIDNDRNKIVLLNEKTMEWEDTENDDKNVEHNMEHVGCSTMEHLSRVEMRYDIPHGICHCIQEFNSSKNFRCYKFVQHIYEEYVDGVIDGNRVIYEGKFVVHSKYKKGKLHGQCEKYVIVRNKRKYERFFANVNNMDELEERTKVQLISRCGYYEGVEHGIHINWSSTGKLRCSKQYEHGFLVGLRQEWHDNNNEKIKCLYRDGQIHGICEVWDYDGNIRVRSNYKNGHLNGEFLIYDINGELEKNLVFCCGHTVGCKQGDEYCHCDHYHLDRVENLEFHYYQDRND